MADGTRKVLDEHDKSLFFLLLKGSILAPACF